MLKEDVRYFARRAALSLLLNKRVVGNPIFRAYMSRRMKRKIAAVAAGAPPRQLTLENTSICNAKCVMCPYPIMERDKIIIDVDLYQKGLRDAKELGIKWVQPQYFGEPLVDKGLGDKIRASRELGLKTTVFSNGSLLDAAKAKMLIESELDEIKISIDSHKPEVYEAIRKGLKFQKVLENVRGLVALRKEMGAKLPKVSVMFVEFEANHTETRDFYKFWSRIVDHVNISRSHNWGGKVTVKGLTILQDEQLRFPCPSPWDQLVVNAQGEILPCCCDYEGTHLSLGNLKTMTLRQAWEGEKMTELRRKHLERRFAEIPLCDACRPNDLW
jgi:radical SAM protein with 4Fe4S-binding SPASM domain